MLAVDDRENTRIVGEKGAARYLHRKPLTTKYSSDLKHFTSMAQGAIHIHILILF